LPPPTPHRLPELHQADKRRFSSVFVKFHLLPPHLSEASSSTFWQFTIQIQILLLFNIQTG
ncbi:hypothetical protein ACVVGQ_004645, partial [Escherichia coli]